VPAESNHRVADQVPMTLHRVRLKAQQRDSLASGMLNDLRQGPFRGRLSE
jgi:hypothetical protein